jgi:hypothetical protein
VIKIDRKKQNILCNIKYFGIMKHISLFDSSYKALSPHNNYSSNTYTFIYLLNYSYCSLYITQEDIKINRKDNRS